MLIHIRVKSKSSVVSSGLPPHRTRFNLLPPLFDTILFNGKAFGAEDSWFGWSGGQGWDL